MGFYGADFQNIIYLEEVSKNKIKIEGNLMKTEWQRIYSVHLVYFIAGFIAMGSLIKIVINIKEITICQLRKSRIF